MGNTEKALSEFIALLGEQKVFSGKNISEQYRSDRTTDLSGTCDLLIIPESTDEVAGALSICDTFNIPVTPRGAGTGVTGGAVPVSGGAVLSLEKLNTIIEIDEDNLTATVEPCVTTGVLQKRVLEKGLFYPPDPASLDECSIGGNVAESAGGMRAVKYGTTKDYLIGVEFVTADGSVMRYGGKFVKNAAGYNMAGLIAGSEGTLAVITKLVLRLIPAPLETRDLLFSFDTLEGAAGAVRLITHSRVVPTAIEFMEEDAVRLVAKYGGEDLPVRASGAHLLVQIDGSTIEEIGRQEKIILAALHDTMSSYAVAHTENERAKLWSARRSIRSSIEKESPVFLAEDCVVPRAAIPVFVAEIKRFLSGKGLRSVLFGHAGDGNVHIDVLRDNLDDAAWRAIVPDLKKGIYTIAIHHRGTITGEHGIGSIRREYLGLAYSAHEIDLMGRIKKAFDPKGILNPGKVL